MDLTQRKAVSSWEAWDCERCKTQVNVENLAFGLRENLLIDSLGARDFLSGIELA